MVDKFSVIHVSIVMAPFKFILLFDYLVVSFVASLYGRTSI
jgi:hypothetical protein